MHRILFPLMYISRIGKDNFVGRKKLRTTYVLYFHTKGLNHLELKEVVNGPPGHIPFAMIEQVRM